MHYVSVFCEIKMMGEIFCTLGIGPPPLAGHISLTPARHAPFAISPTPLRELDSGQIFDSVDFTIILFFMAGELLK